MGQGEGQGTDSVKISCTCFLEQGSGSSTNSCRLPIKAGMPLVLNGSSVAHLSEAAHKVHDRADRGVVELSCKVPE